MKVFVHHVSSSFSTAKCLSFANFKSFRGTLRGLNIDDHLTVSIVNKSNSFSKLPNRQTIYQFSISNG